MTTQLRRTRRLMGVLLAGSLLGLTGPATAQQALSVDIAKGRLSWAAGAGGGKVEEYRVKCGIEPGVYTLPVVKVLPPATGTPIKSAVPAPGKYFCVVTAANEHGESDPSNEVAVLLTATTSEPVQPPEAARLPSGGNHLAELGEYKIGPEDVLQISVWKNELLTRLVTVRPDGKISLPLVNDVQAAGLTPLELRDALAKKLTDYMPAPEVAVIVTEVRSLKVSVIGEVVRPGRYELKSHHTVLDVLSLAGGLTPFAARSRIVILRLNGNTMQQIPFNYSKLGSGGLLDKILNFGGGEQENLYLRPGDIVLVP